MLRLGGQKKKEVAQTSPAQELSFAHCVIVGDVSQASALCRPATPCNALRLTGLLLVTPSWDRTALLLILIEVSG